MKKMVVSILGSDGIGILLFECVGSSSVVGMKDSDASHWECLLLAVEA